MHEILVISGKGGTGKTSLTAAFAHLSANAIICDLDVDAPDLHLLLNPERQLTHEFHAGHEAVIRPDKCEDCGTCIQMCAFDAVQPGESHPVINPLKCEGCKVCVEFCPAGAVAFEPKHCGTWYVSDTRMGPMVHAQLLPAEENSGRLVALLRQEAREMARKQGRPIILADGPPGIGCPVISALSGVTLAVVVTEPTPSGLHDMARITDLCDHFQIPAAVIVNKYDLNPVIADRIGESCRQKGYALVARLDHDLDFIHAMVEGRTITEFSTGATVRKIKEAWEKILSLVADHESSKFKVNEKGVKEHEHDYRHSF